MPTKQPQLGSLALQTPLSPRMVRVEPGTCHDLSLFKGNLLFPRPCANPYNTRDAEILREYRRLDDSITMRLNRANAAMRDSSRLDNSSGNIQDRACLNVWRELSLNEKRSLVEDEMKDNANKREMQGHIYAEQVKRMQVHNELKVESIIRKRVVEAFKTRCQFFVPPLDSEAREVWDAAK
ncbi:hypothetical protein DXG01_006323 [Tephrocybe rancida]|nr:hypothetical protein DXG01_006323 [Tephrocybe rancida]